MEIAPNHKTEPTSHGPTKEQRPWNMLSSAVFVALVAVAIYFLDSQNKLPTSISVFDFFVIIFATFRITFLLVYDSVTHYIRDFFEQFQTGPGRTVANLIYCPWCVGVWMAFIVSFFYFVTKFAWYPIFIFSLAGLGSLIIITAQRIMERESLEKNKQNNNSSHKPQH